MSRTFVIGDVHGCLDALERLLVRLDADPSVDRLWFCGDLVNRGPQSLGVLRRVMAMGEAATVVLGNHDLHLLAVLHGIREPSRKDTLGDILDAPDRDELIDWLRHRPVLHAEDRACIEPVLVHAGIPPEWDLDAALDCAHRLERVLRDNDYVDFLKRMYGDSPGRWRDAKSRTDRLRFTVNAFTRMRYCHPGGAIDLDESGPPSTVEQLLPWYRVRNRRPIDRPVLFGHWSSHPAMAPAGILPLDRGCVWGGDLAGLRIDVRGEVMRSVKAG